MRGHSGYRHNTKTKSTYNNHTHFNKLKIDYHGFQRLPLSLNDFVKAARQLYLKHKLMESPKATLFAMMEKGNIFAISRLRHKNPFKWLAKEFKPYLPGATPEITEAVFLKERVKQLNRDHRVMYERMIKHLKYRLYPLSPEKYEEFANEVWNKRGRPHFGFKKISNITWNNADTITGGGRILRRDLALVLGKGELYFQSADSFVPDRMD